MSDAVIRTEDINPRDIKKYFVETTEDRNIINSLKSRQAMLLVGSRGTGKTMLMKIAEKEVSEAFPTNKVLPVFVNLSSCSVYDIPQVLPVIISRTLISLKKSLREHGIILKGTIFNPILSVQENPIVAKLEKYINDVTSQSDDSEEAIEINNEAIRKDTAQLIDFLSELCETFDIRSIMFFFDEACQVFRPTQQRIFFDFFRSLRTYNIVCKAAVYPGILTYGSFQKFHDAVVIQIQRSITSSDYISKMREIIKNNFQEYDNLIIQGDLLDNIIFYSSGNPRFLIKSINEILMGGSKFTTKRANEVVKEFYGTTIWSEHIKLSEMYSGHTDMINWARNFIENTVLPAIHKFNDNPDSKKTIYFAISRKSPEVVKQAIKTLEYSGIISLHTEGTKYRNEMYDRYELNLGVVVLSEKKVSIQQRGREIVSNLSIKVFPDYGANSQSYNNYDKLIDVTNVEVNSDNILNAVTMRSVDVLELSSTMKDKLHSYGFNTIKDILTRSEDELRQIPYVGTIRSRKISNLVYNAILEYISG